MAAPFLPQPGPLWQIVTTMLVGDLVYPLFALGSLFSGDPGHSGLPELGVSFLSTLSTVAIFTAYNLVAMFVAVTSLLRARVMYLFENLFDAKALFTTIGVLIIRIAGYYRAGV